VRRASEVLEQLGLAERMTHRPADLSGGEQQRVAIARAIVKRPEILFADEPTGNLDFENALQTAELLASLNREGLTVLMVTHNRELAQQYAKVTIRMSYGRIVTPDDGAGAQP
jgi:ABC-type ATPase involved in cell division